MATTSATHKTLTASLLADEDKRRTLLTDCVQFIHEEVASQSGLTALAIQAAYKFISISKPDSIRQVMDVLLDDFVQCLEPFYSDYKRGQTPFSTFSDTFHLRRDEITDAFLNVADKLTMQMKAFELKNVYGKLRPKAKRLLRDAVPRLGRILSAHVDS